ncbi:hypothetical protein, partial [Paraburkholderia tropica]|uniref:hypothetical protein n=1 Tax=Paraburkholderia tropica TaxID=92647 RepID=UPI001C85DBD5
VCCVAASAAEKRDYEVSFSFRQHLFLRRRLKSLLILRTRWFRRGLRCGVLLVACSEGGEC